MTVRVSKEIRALELGIKNPQDCRRENKKAQKQ